ncbi:MAG: hypothetical protein M1132_12550 [Chloroflexi bacterium]|nr:hypothetical protein [Chloroflexota bacterium]MCL5952526.1 hypothetical protein [Chloroflexota bacterium]
MAPIVRPDIHTPFHIDFGWFEQNGRDLREEMYDALCEECRALYPSPAEKRLVDRVDPETAQVMRVDALWECLADHCGQKPGFITPATPLTTAIFRALLANENRPLTPEQLHRRIGKSNPNSILRVLMGAQIENGIVPAEGDGKQV